MRDIKDRLESIEKRENGNHALMKLNSCVGILILLLFMVVPQFSAYAQSGFWVMEKIGYQENRDDPNYLTSREYLLNNPQQSGSRGKLVTSIFYAKRSKMTVAWGWNDPPTVIPIGSEVSITISAKVVENNNAGNYSYRAIGSATSLGNIYPEKTGGVAGGQFFDDKGNYNINLDQNTPAGTYLVRTFKAKISGGSSLSPDILTIRISLGLGFEPRFYYIYRLSADGKPGKITVDKGAGGGGTSVTPTPQTLGYQLYFDGKLVSGPDAAHYSYEQARQDCTTNMQRKPEIDIRCVYNGKIIAERSASTTGTQKSQSVDLVNTMNIDRVYNSPTNSTTFVTNRSVLVTHIMTYHWNNARGRAPGTIGLQSKNGKIYGPWKAKGSPGQGGVSDAMWEVFPGVVIPAGTYTVIDSDPATWSQNSASGGRGMGFVKGNSRL